MSLVFVSYSRQDQEFVLRLVADLRRAGVPVWLDQADIAPGERWDMAIETALKAATHLLIVISSISAQSNNVRDEIDLAIDSKKIVVPVLVSDTDMPLRIRRMQYTDFRQDYAQGLERLLKVLPHDPADKLPTTPIKLPPAVQSPAPPVTSPAPPAPRARNQLLIGLAALILIAVIGGAVIIAPRLSATLTSTSTVTSAPTQIPALPTNPETQAAQVRAQLLTASAIASFVNSDATRPARTIIAVQDTATAGVAAALATPSTTKTPSATATTAPSATVTEKPNAETLVAIMRTQQLTLTANAVASQPTPDDKATALAIIAAQDTGTAAAQTAIAISSLTKTPTPTRTATPTNTPLPTNTPTMTPTATFSPGAARTDAGGVEQVFVPAGCFQMGSDPKVDSFAANDEQPQHEVCITHGFWLDRTEVTNAAYQKFIDAGGYTKRDYWSDEGWQWLQASQHSGPANYVDTIQPKQPRVGVSWYEAEAYARWRSGRLPTEAEWEYAARGPKSPIYPWGDSYLNGRANLNGTQNGILTVGSFPSGRGWIGADDMIGNAWEWIADWYLGNYYDQRIKDDPPGPGNTNYRVLRGSSWFVPYTAARAAARGRGSPDTRTDRLGFRIISSTTP